MTIIHDPVVGKQLSLWTDQAAIDRQAFEKQLYDAAISAGFNRIVTPHICLEELIQTPIIPQHEQDRLRRLTGPKPEEDSAVYVFPAPKQLLHLRLMTRKPISVHQLPFKVFEICELYPGESKIVEENETLVYGSPIGNQFGIVLTGYCVDEDMALIVQKKMDQIAKIKSPNFKPDWGESDRQKLPDSFQYTGADNAKHTAWYVTTRITWKWKP